MNIYKGKYGIVKKELYAFGRKIGMDNDIIYTQKYWEKKFLSLHEEKSWDYVITAYLAFWCSEEERRFTTSVFFMRNAVRTVSMSMYISEAACYAKKERIMDCLLGLAIQCKLITVDITNGSFLRETVCCIEWIIDDEQWKNIENVIIKSDRRALKHAQKSIEAMVYIIRNHIPWRELPTYYGLWKSIYNRYTRWQKSGLWRSICQILGFEE